MKFIYKWLAILGFGLSAYLYLKNNKNINKDLQNISKKANSLYSKVSRTLEQNRDGLMDEVKEFEQEILKDKNFQKAKETVREIVKKVAPKTPAPTKITSNLSTGVNRIDKIQRLISDKTEIAIPEIRKHFAGVSERTLRRDMDKLEKLGVVKQVGKTKNSYYELL